MFKAAAVQLAIGTDAGENLEKCCRWVRQAAAEGAELVVLPEFCHRDARFSSAAQAYALAITEEDPFLTRLRGEAGAAGVHLAVNVMIRGERPQVRGTTFLIGPDGSVLGRYSKHVPFGGQRSWLTLGQEAYPVFDTPLARFGLYVCMDGLMPEATRCLALGGAEVLLNCLQSAGPDEPDLHIPVRALENGVWIVAANKVGAIPGGHAALFTGGSVIVGPDGEVRARADEQSETAIYADIDPRLADRGRLSGRRPTAYAGLYRPSARAVHVSGPRPAAGAELVVGAAEPVPGVWTIVSAGGEIAVFDPAGGRCAGYRPVHPGPGGTFTVVRAPFGDIGLSGGDDLWYPEAARCVALAGADLLVHFGEWHDLLLIERAAENRMVALAVDDGRHAVVRLGPTLSDPHWRARMPEIERVERLDTVLDLAPARDKGDQLAGRLAEQAALLVAQPVPSGS